MPNFSAALVQTSIFRCKLIQRLVWSTLVWIQTPLLVAEGNEGQEQTGASLTSTTWVSVRALADLWAHPALPGMESAAERLRKESTKCNLLICHHSICYCTASFGGTLHKNPQLPNLVPAALALAGSACSKSEHRHDPELDLFHISWETQLVGATVLYWIQICGTHPVRRWKFSSWVT